MFAQAEPPGVPGPTLVPGLFADTVPGVAAERPGPIAFLHLDADLYSSTVTVLDSLGTRFEFTGFTRADQQVSLRIVDAD